MKYKEYLKGLIDFAKENPEVLELEVVTSDDDEGNRYHRVHYGPSLGHLDSDGDFSSKDNYEDMELDEDSTNSVCVN